MDHNLEISTYNPLNYKMGNIKMHRIGKKIVKEKQNVVPAMSDSEVMLCLQSYQGLKIDI